GGGFHIDLEELKGLDGEDEAALLSSVFMMIRAGKVQDACALCTKAGQSWRAASIAGSMPMGDNEDEDGNDNGSFFGNPKFALWRRTCWKLGFYDHLWVHFRCMVERATDECTFAHSKRRREVGVKYPFAGAGGGAGGKKAEDEQLAETGALANIDEGYAVDSFRSEEAHLLWNKAVSALILAEGQVSSFVSTALKEGGGGGMGGRWLRFAANFVAFFKVIGGGEGQGGGAVDEEDACEILKNYIAFLVDNKQVELVATYCSLLPEDACVETYAQTLMVVEDLEERKRMFGRGMDLFPELMEEILVLTVERIRDSEEFEDARKMKSLEYLCIDPAYRLEGLVQANSLLRMLLLQGKIESCKLLVVKYWPADSVRVIRELIEGNEEGRGEKLEESGESVIWEHESLVAVIIAHTKFDLWREIVTKVEDDERRLAEGSLIGGGGMGLNKVELEIFEKSKERERREKLDRGRREVEDAAGDALVALQIVLQYAGGFLYMSDEEVKEDNVRGDEIASLRKGLIPTVVNLIAYLLCVMGAFFEKEGEGGKEKARGQYQQVVDLASILTDERHKIMECMKQEDAAAILEKVAEAQVNVLRCEEK
ncbi:hypothetical protein TrRE_jg4143, partial [Triparma retinervis]